MFSPSDTKDHKEAGTAAPAASATTSSAAAALPPLTVMTLNELEHRWTKYNMPAGPKCPKATESQTQMHARHAIMDSFTLNELPDVVMLQEISSNRHEVVAKRFSNDYHIFLSHNVKTDGTGEDACGGCAVFLRRDTGWDMKSIRGYPFAFSKQKPQDDMIRIALAVVAKRGGQEYVFMSVHLEGQPTTLGAELRVAQVSEAVDFARTKSPKGRIFVAGDFNEPAESMDAILRAMGARDMHAVSNTSITFARNNQVLDYMFVSSKQAAGSATYRVHPKERNKSMPLAPYEWAGWGSDHSALLVTFPNM